jgi:hypothetical protein
MMEIHAAQIIALLITGVGVGFASGMLGVGGCFIMVPVQFWALTSIGVDPTIAIRIAFGTNLLVVLPTAFSGAMTHHKKGAVLWKAGVTFGIAGAIGAFFGAFIASHLPGKVLTAAFGIAVILGAIRMLTAKPPQITDEPSDSMAAFILWGIPLGIVSGIVGIGGGGFDDPHHGLFPQIQDAPGRGHLHGPDALHGRRRIALLLNKRSRCPRPAALFHGLFKLAAVDPTGRMQHPHGHRWRENSPSFACQAAQIYLYRGDVLHGPQDDRGVFVAAFADIVRKGE